MSARDDRVQGELNRAADAANAWNAKNHADGGVCDFCCHLLGDGPSVTYEALPIRGTLSAIAEDLGAGTIDFGFDPFWAACPACEAVVDRGDVDEMVENAIANRDVERTGSVPDEVMSLFREDLAELYRAFLARRPRKLGMVRP